MRKSSPEETGSGKTYHLWPVSASGRFWIWVMFAGCAVFLSGVFMGAAGIPAAGWTSIAGMGLFFLGALLRLKFD